MKPSRPIQGYSNPSARRANLFAAVSVLAFVVGCGNGDVAGPVDDGSGTSTSRPGQREATGSVSFELTTAGDVEFNSFRYAITGPGFSKAGNIDVSDSTTVSALIEGIPVGTGYSLTLTGTSIRAPRASCSGSASFAVAASTVTTVPVSVACHLLDVAAVPIPPFAPVLLGFALLAAGVAPAIRRRRRSV